MIQKKSNKRANEQVNDRPNKNISDRRGYEDDTIQKLQRKVSYVYTDQWNPTVIKTVSNTTGKRTDVGRKLDY